MLFYSGDSLVDTGNLLEVTSLGTVLADAFGIPIEYPGEILYSSIGIGNPLAQPETSIDLYLGELLDIPNPTSFPFSNLDNPDYADPLVDFSISAATTGEFGSTSVSLDGGLTDLGDQPFGLLSQAAYIQASFALNPAFYEAYGGGTSDLLVSGGANDIFNFLDQDGDKILNQDILDALLSPGNQDDNERIEYITGHVVNNISQFLGMVSGFFDDIVVLGPPKLAETPLLLGIAESLNSDEKGAGFAGQFLGDKFTRFVSRLTDTMNKEISKAVNNLYGDKVLFIDGERAFDAAITTSYRQFDTISAYQTAYFQDDVHPNYPTSTLVADYVSSEVFKEFGEFG